MTNSFFLNNQFNSLFLLNLYFVSGWCGEKRKNVYTNFGEIEFSYRLKIGGL